MVRTYQRKSTYSKYNKEHILRAVKAIKVDSQSLTKVADEFGIKVSSLYYHLNRYKDYDFTKEKDIKELKNTNQVFTKELEYEFAEKVIDATDNCVALGPTNVRKFAYEFALQHELDLRQTWMENEAAGEDWLNSFLKRHPVINSISTFHANSVQIFYRNYQQLLERLGFQDRNIFKVDEIAFTTAKQPNRVFARRGKKETSELQSISQDELTTMVSTVSASGLALAPMFVIPRTGFVSDMIEKAMGGSIKVSNKSGWITKSDFLEYLAHFVKVAQCNKTDPCLMILDNHASCLCLDAIAYAKENGIFMLMLPAHTYNKLQPLKDKVFVGLRTKVNEACKDWAACNPKKSMKIKDIIAIVETIFPTVFTKSDIRIGFESSNIYPLKNKVDSGDNTSTSENIVNIVSLDITNEDDICHEFEGVQSSIDLKYSTKVPLSEIEMILGISSSLETKENDIVNTEQKENIDDHRDNEGEQKFSNKQPKLEEDMIIKSVSNLSMRNKLDKPDKNEPGKRKRRKPKMNSKLSDYVCY